ncbi:alpha/beta fold hydrolase [Geodermatophilus sp. CPCC 205761]|uniref:alpha/beta fold hydrolase n=1 Tax=Geodermatophilus sp. CPCC 205761 TaxID=2936597 RepID=UPI003EEC962A
MDALVRTTLPDGSEMAHAEVGAPGGSAVLYFHGTPSSRLEATIGLDDVADRLGLRILAPDRPGIGESQLRAYQVRDYPGIVSAFLDVLAIEEVSVVGVSGGGRYACACAAALGPRVRRLALVASTASPDLPGVRRTWGRQDRLLYGLAVRAPWLFRALMAKLSRDLRRDPTAALKLFPPLSAPDQDVLADPGVSQALQGVLREALRHGTRGVTHDFALEARPWGVDLRQIRVPVDVWFGEEDTIVAPAQGRLLAAATPGANVCSVPGEGHLSLRVRRMVDVLQRLA